MFIFLWFVSGAIFGNFLCGVEKISYPKNLKALKPYKWSMFFYFSISVIAPFLWMKSVSMAGVGDAVLIGSATTLIPILWGIFYFKEKFKWLDWIILLMVFLGVFIFISKEREVLGTSAFLVFVASALYSIQGIFKKVFLGKVDYVFVVTLRAAFTAITAFLLAIYSDLLVFPTEWWIYALCFVGGIFGSFAHKIFWFKSLETMELSRYSIFMKLKTVIVYALAVLFLGETLTVQKLIGGSLILLGGMFFSQKKEAKKEVQTKQSK